MAVCDSVYRFNVELSDSDFGRRVSRASSPASICSINFIDLKKYKMNKKVGLPPLWRQKQGQVWLYAITFVALTYSQQRVHMQHWWMKGMSQESGGK